jgi:5-methylcytosine-specific restriction endonuclease McrA
MRTRARLRRAGGKRVCGICGGIVDMTLPSWHPLSFQLDHIVPRKFGGTDHLSNLRVTHHRCNKARGAGGRRPTTPDDVSATW